MKGKSFHTVAAHEVVRRKWTHPDPDDLKRLLAGELAPQRAVALRRHLRGCQGCSLLAARVAVHQDLEGME